ncbi:MAG: transposase [Candidatus Schekmanbacteria bacterium]|nr:transposase [Candidatus Schekmanbacteria bacterium]
MWFVVHLRRWVVEHTLASLGFRRRLSKDYEALPETSQTTILIAMIRTWCAECSDPARGVRMCCCTAAAARYGRAARLGHGRRRIAMHFRRSSKRARATSHGSGSYLKRSTRRQNWRRKEQETDMVFDDESQREAVEARLVARALAEPEFRRWLESDPRAAIEQEIGSPLPEGMDICVMRESASQLYLVLPAGE